MKIKPQMQYASGILPQGLGVSVRVWDGPMAGHGARQTPADLPQLGTSRCCLR